MVLRLATALLWTARVRLNHDLKVARLAICECVYAPAP